MRGLPQTGLRLVTETKFRSTFLDYCINGGSLRINLLQWAAVTDAQLDEIAKLAKQ